MKVKIRKYILAAFAFSLLSIVMVQEASAQKYRVAAGWRAGTMSNGVTLKIIPVRGIAVEGMLNLYPYGPSVGMTVQSTHPVFCIEALQLYGGVGAHYRFGYYSGDYYDPLNGFYTVIPPAGTRGVGLDAIAGVELKLPLLPIAISAEVKPNIEFTNFGNVFYGLDPGVGIKIAF